MTTPTNPNALVDPGNALLAHVPARLDTGSVDLPGEGKYGVMTIRTGSTTLTVMLGAEDLRQWGGILTGLADQLTGGLVQASPFDISALDQMSDVIARRTRGR